jgi:beta-lactamase class A
LSYPISRRAALSRLGLVPFAFASRGVFLFEETDEQLSRLEHASGGRLGVAIQDTASGVIQKHRGDQQFPMCSTFKLLAVGAVLARVDRGAERLDRRIPFTQADLLEYAPITRARVAEGAMTLGELCEAAITVSDNTAANLILTTVGGPGGVTSYARSIGDSVTRLDRIEPQLNQAQPGDARDTTSPLSMLQDLRQLLIGDALSSGSREKLTAWLVANKTGAARLRAGFPGGWRVGDKTGTGNNGTTNDVGIVWPPGRAPILVAVYLTESTASMEVRERTIADLARLVARPVGQA